MPTYRYTVGPLNVHPLQFSPPAMFTPCNVHSLQRFSSNLILFFFISFFLPSLPSSHLSPLANRLKGSRIGESPKKNILQPQIRIEVVCIQVVVEVVLIVVLYLVVVVLVLVVVVIIEVVVV